MSFYDNVGKAATRDTECPTEPVPTPPFMSLDSVVWSNVGTLQVGNALPSPLPSHSHEKQQANVCPQKFPSFAWSLPCLGVTPSWLNASVTTQ